MVDVSSQESTHRAISAIRHGLVVSCQAPVSSPLHNPMVIAAIAQASLQQGAVGVRIDTPAHVSAVRQSTNAPIIGIWKRQFDGSEVYITPQFEQAEAIAQAGADIIAIDATQRPRPGGESVAMLIDQIHDRLHKPVMADVATLKEAIAAVEAGVDVVGTTLYGYTAETRHLAPPGWDLLTEMVHQLSVPIICEGGVASPEMARKALELGAYAVVVGTAITGIDSQVKRYVGALQA